MAVAQRAALFVGRRDAFEGVFKIARGKLVFCVVAGNGDNNLVRQRSGLAEIRLARRGKQCGLGLRRGEGCSGKQRGKGHARERD